MWWSSRQAGAHERHAFDHYGRVAKLALKRRRVQWHSPRAPTLEPSKGRRPKNRATKKGAPTQELAQSKRNVFRPWCPVFALAWLAAPVPFLGCSFPRARSCLCLFLLLFLLLAAGVTFQLLEGGTSGQTQGHRPKNWYRAPTQERPFRYPFWTFDVLRLWHPASEASSRRDTWSCASRRVRLMALACAPGRQY